jgi:ketosteroid isomerase-like protein
LSDLHAHVYGDFAYIRGMADAIDAQAKVTRVRFTDIYTYRDGRWQCVAGHESLVAAAFH